MTTLHLACAADIAYVPHSAAMIHSVLANQVETTIHVHYLHGPDLPDRCKRMLAEMVEGNGGTIDFFLIPDTWVQALPRSEHVTLPMWYRIFLPELLPAVNQLLYLDCDTLVLTGLEPLARMDLGEHHLGAVTNVFEPHFADHPQELGLSGRDAYFNSGVLLMNLTTMRASGATEQLRAYGTAHGPGMLWPDQDTLNVVLGSRRLPLHPRWNCMNSVMTFPSSSVVFGPEAVTEARARPAIRHFEGPAFSKPWHYLCQLEMRELYFWHRSQTPWPRVAPDGVTARNVLLRFKRGLRAAGN